MFRIKSSVGRLGRNQKSDAQTIQNLLNTGPRQEHAPVRCVCSQAPILLGGIKQQRLQETVYWCGTGISAMASLSRGRISTWLALGTLALSVVSCRKLGATSAAPQAQNVEAPTSPPMTKPPDPEQKREASTPTTDLPSRDGMRFIPQTKFFAGVEPAHDDGVEPGHEAQAGPLYMDTFEVTVEQYRRCVDTQACSRPSDTDRKCNYSQKHREQHPMNCIDWYAADRFCRAQNKRLPSADEWQLAARGSDRRIYPWGKTEPDSSRCCRASPNASKSSTCQVGTHPAGASAFGVQDMAGNVAEWTSTKSPVASGTAYDVYGGGYAVDEMETPKWRDIRLDMPNSYSPSDTAPDLGFRCASDAS